MSLIAAVSAVILLGAFLRRSGVINEEAGRGVSRICADILLPCMILNSMILELTRETIAQSLTLIVSASVALLVQFLIGLGFVRLFRVPVDDRMIYRYSILFPILA